MKNISSPLIMCIKNNNLKLFNILKNYAKIPEEMIEYLDPKIKILLQFLKKNNNLIQQVIMNQIKQINQSN